ncbi:hypothetical protein GCM10017562_73160 [Streptomyces roseofulvus]|uniref:hypothetical protein n=1 Tax=Streptomyces roseofulvus TaxID=33902 RepID=UPI0031FDDCD0
MAAKTTTTPASFRIDRILGDRPFAEVGEPALTVRDENRGLLAVAGTRTAVAGMPDFGFITPVGVYRVEDLTCTTLPHAHHPVHAMAFHPTLPVLAVGSGAYDGATSRRESCFSWAWRRGAPRR